MTDNVIEAISDPKESIMKKSDSTTKKNVSISEELSYYNDLEDASDVNTEICEQNLTEDYINKTHCSTGTMTLDDFNMEDYLIGLDSNDITKINDYVIKGDIVGDGKFRNVNCNTLYAVDIFSLNNAIVNSQDKRKTKEERKREREKKKEEELMKKYQIEQENKNRAIARSRCGRWVKFNIKIGEGGYKFVYKGYDVTEARNIAWCEFKHDHVDTREKRSAMIRETDLMLQMNHSHIVRCFGVLSAWDITEDPQRTIEGKGIVIIQELMGEGTLKNMIKKNFVDGQCILRSSLTLEWCHQVLDALKYMHHKCTPPIIHRDLKADNCFLYSQADDECLNVKVGDFGLATHVKTSGRKTMLGTMGFMAPEIFDEKYDEKVDIYAFGMLMLEVMTNRTPFDDCVTLVQVAAKTLCGEGPAVLETVKDKCLQEIIKICIHPMSCYRPTAEELYLHPKFQKTKGLLLQVELNYDKKVERIEEYDKFFETFPGNTKVNLRLKFREKRMQQELGLDDTESLEFDLDIYKGEDQDIPELIQNLRSEYEDKLVKFYDSPKIIDKTKIDDNLNKLFSSIRLQLQYLVKYILGRRWRDILDGLVAQMKVKSGNDIDNDDIGVRFTGIGEYKKLWNKAKRLLDNEINSYCVTPKTPTIIPEEKIVNLTEVHEDIEDTLPINPVNITSQVEQPASPDFLQPIEIDATLIQSIDNNQNIINTRYPPPTLPPTVPINKIDMVPVCNNGEFINTEEYIEYKPPEIIEKETVSIPHQPYGITVHKIKSYGQYIKIKVSVAIPIENGKYAAEFKIVTPQSSNTDGLTIEIPQLSQQMNLNKEVMLALQETFAAIIRHASQNKDIIPINQVIVFYPPSENSLLADMFREKSSSDSSVQFKNQSNTIEKLESKDEQFANYFKEIDEYFDNDSKVLLSKKVHNDKEIIEAYQIPAGSAVLIYSDGTVKNIMKTSLVTPKLTQNGDIHVKEFDSNSASFESIMQLLSNFHESLTETSRNYIQPHEFKSKVLPSTIIETKQRLYDDNHMKTKIINNDVSISEYVAQNERYKRQQTMNKTRKVTTDIDLQQQQQIINNEDSISSNNPKIMANFMPYPTAVPYDIQQMTGVPINPMYNMVNPHNFKFVNFTPNDTITNNQVPTIKPTSQQQQTVTNEQAALITDPNLRHIAYRTESNPIQTDYIQKNNAHLIYSNPYTDDNTTRNVFAQHQQQQHQQQHQQQQQSQQQQQQQQFYYYSKDKNNYVIQQTPPNYLTYSEQNTLFQRSNIQYCPPTSNDESINKKDNNLTDKLLESSHDPLMESQSLPERNIQNVGNINLTEQNPQIL